MSSEENPHGVAKRWSLSPVSRYLPPRGSQLASYRETSAYEDSAVQPTFLAEKINGHWKFHSEGDQKKISDTINLCWRLPEEG